MRYTTIGSDPASARRVSVLNLGAMRFGTVADEATSFAILDRFVEAGGNFIDTANNYLYLVNGTRGGESEELLRRWRASRGIGDEIVIASKVDGRPVSPTRDSNAPREACRVQRSVRPARRAASASASIGSTCTTRTSPTRQESHWRRRSVRSASWSATARSACSG